jgi:hypothetical protein
MKLAAATLVASLALASLLASRAEAAVSRAPKSYAVFLATYDPTTGQAVGGVAGSAFFVTPTKAITAYHVLQPKSFSNPRTQVWLVHEGERAIALSARDLRASPSNDKTEIELSTARAPARHVFSVAVPKAGDRVETDGFLANTTGPLLAIDDTPTEAGGPRLKITSVPHLERLHAEGHILRELNVELASSDVNLKNAACVQLSYKPIVGLSGGPVFTGNSVIGMNSFADPAARESTWAVKVN